MDKKQKAEKIYKFLKRKYGSFIKQHYSHSNDAFRILISVLLSQRTREELTLEKDALLFDKLKLRIDDFLKLSENQIAELIKPVGFYRQKAKRIKQLCKILKEKYNCKVPLKREELLKLPGIGKKSADVVVNALVKPTIAIDVHVEIISKRIGLVKMNTGYDEIQQNLHRLFKVRERKIVNLGLVLFGKEICLTNKPKCKICPFRTFCNYGRKILKNSEILY